MGLQSWRDDIRLTPNVLTSSFMTFLGLNSEQDIEDMFHCRWLAVFVGPGAVVISGEHCTLAVPPEYGIRVGWACKPVIPAGCWTTQYGFCKFPLPVKRSIFAGAW